MNLRHGIDTFSPGRYTAEAAYAPLLRHLNLTEGQSWFEHPGVVVWRDLPDRQNAVLDVTDAEGNSRRLHVKRYKPTKQKPHPADDEAAGVAHLRKAGIATIPLLATGFLPDGRGFVVSEDLADHVAADELLRKGVPLDDLLEPTARLAARLHMAGLHHRDLYPCHVFVRRDDASDVRLIDAARVRPLPRCFPQRWIVKDLAQFRYGLMRAGVRAPDADRWLTAYAEHVGVRDDLPRLRRLVAAKTAHIGRHDARVRRHRPERDRSVPRP